MSQVRNLRAMFENKGEQDSPGSLERGRSPAGFGPSTHSGANASQSPASRPLSRIRNDFIAVEKDGRIGIQRNPSSDSILSRTQSYNNETDSSREHARKMFASPPIQEAPIDPFDRNESANIPAAVTDKPSVNPDHHVDVEEATPELRPVEAPSEASKSSEFKGTADAKQSVAKAGPRLKMGASKPTTTDAVPQPPTSATRKAEVTKGARSTKLSTDTANKKLGSSTSGNAATSAQRKKVDPIRTGHGSQTGFVKPKPKSPTKPVALPSTLTAPTASSSSKGARGSLATSGSLGSLAGPSQSRPRTGLTTSASSQRFPKPRSSTLDRPRPSIGSFGPPPKKAESSGHKNRDSHVDEDFLARMMRPTQSSSSKTFDKAPATPPKKTAKADSNLGPGSRLAPSTTSSRRSAGSRSSTSRHGARSVERTIKSPQSSTVASVPVAEAAPSTATSADTVALTAQPSRDEESHEEAAEPEAVMEEAAREAHQQTPMNVEETAQVETAEEIADLAEDTDLVEPSTELQPTVTGTAVIEADDSVVPQVPPVEESLTQIAEVETAEKAIEIAKEAKLDQSSMVVENETNDSAALNKEKATGLTSVVPSVAPEADVTREDDTTEELLAESTRNMRLHDEGATAGYEESEEEL